jgi:general secretion pathway protein K
MNLSPDKYRRKQQGVALIIVLLIVAIVSVLATEMGGRLQLQVKRASNIKENNQAYWYAMGAEQYARKSIRKLLDEDGEVIHLQQPWVQEFVYPIEGGGIQAQLVDMQSCFNLNALKAPAPLNGQNGQNGQNTNGTKLSDEAAAFGRLMQHIDEDIPSFTIDTVRESLVDWLDEDDSPLLLGAEDSEYESRQFPYIAANNFMLHKSELRLINGVENAWLDALLKLVCVLPNDNLFKINVNTVSEENAAVIAAATGLPLRDAQSVLANRGNEGYKNIEEFLNTQEIQGLSLNAQQKTWFDIKTSHFILYTKTQYNNASFAMQTVFKVDEDNAVSVIRREFSSVR